MSEGPEIVIVDANHPIEPAEIARLTGLFFKDPAVRDRVRAVTVELIDPRESGK